jgi:serine/threonine-protein kinase RsbW
VLEEEIALLAHPAELDALHAALGRFFAAIDRVGLPQPDPAARVRFATGVAELANNIMRHGYPADRPGPISLSLRLYDGRAEAQVVDLGVALPARSASVALDVPMDGELAEGGRGFAIIRAVVDELSYQRREDGTNHWRLVQRLAD